MSYRLNLLSEEASLTNVAHYRIEDITTNKEIYTKLLYMISEIEEKEDSDYITNVFTLSPIHRHRITGTLNPQEQFQQWSSYKQDIFKYWANKSKIFEKYYKFDYSFFTVNMEKQNIIY
jgi:hypothetical protein